MLTSRSQIWKLNYEQTKGCTPAITVKKEPSVQAMGRHFFFNLWDWTKSKCLIQQTVLAREWESQHSKGCGECKTAVCMDGNSARSIKSFDSRAHWPINPTALEWIPQTYSNICMQSWMYKAIHCSTVYNNRRLETVWMSIKRGLLRQIAMHP